MPTYRVLVRETVYTNYTVESPDADAARRAVAEGVYSDSELMESNPDEIISVEER